MKFIKKSSQKAERFQPLKIGLNRDYVLKRLEIDLKNDDTSLEEIERTYKRAKKDLYSDYGKGERVVDTWYGECLLSEWVRTLGIACTRWIGRS